MVFWAQPAESYRLFQIAKIESYRRDGLKTKEDVRALISWMRDPVIGTKKNCLLDDHCAPITFVEDVLLDRVQSFLVWANRSGSKSYLAGLLTWIRSSLLPRLETLVLGGSFEQSEKIYKAMNDFWESTGLAPYYRAGDPVRQKTCWQNGSEVHVLTASTRSVRGPHPQALFMDEIDEMDEEVYTSALSQPQSKYGIRALLGKLSTNHRQGGMMDAAVKAVEGSGTSLYKWCVWECLKPCVDYSCSTCKLSGLCPGKHMKEADGYYEVDDFVRKLYDLNMVTLNTEWFCVKAGKSDLVYGAQFEIDRNAATSVPGFSSKKKAILSIDWGGTEPFSLGVWQDFTREKVGWVRVDEMYLGNTTNQRMIAEAKTKPWWKNAKEMVADPSRPDLIREWRELGLSVYPADNSVDAGIESVRDCLDPVLGNPTLYVNRKCRWWLFEVGAYTERNGAPVKKNDHAMDETRYFVRRYLRPARVARIRSLT